MPVQIVMFSRVLQQIFYTVYFLLPSPSITFVLLTGFSKNKIL